MQAVRSKSDPELDRVDRLLNLDPGRVEGVETGTAEDTGVFKTMVSEG